MTRYVYGFKELPPALAHTAGGKGALLSLLCQKGYPVPNGFVILSSAFGAGGLLPEAWKQVQTYLHRLTEGRGFTGAVAVRSSAVGEDSEKTSFAGAFDTKLNVHGRSDIYKAIQDVFNSKDATRVKTYTKARGVASGPIMAVVIQAMVPAVISGVLFSTNPVSGSPAIMRGAWIKGLGDQLVSGKHGGQSFALKRPGGGYQGPPEMRSAAGRLFKLAIRLERELASPQDMEWALAGKKLYLLQTRPITTGDRAGPEKNDSLDGDCLWSNVNFGEAIPDVMTPLTASAIEKGPIAKEISFNGTSAYGVICGRPYLNISVLASMLSAIGKSNAKIISFLDDLLHLSLPPGTRVPIISSSKKAVIKALFLWIVFGWRQKLDLRKIPILLAQNPAWCRQMHWKISAVKSGEELIELWEQSLEPHLSRIWFSLVSSTNHFTAYAVALKNKLAAIAGPDATDTLLSGLNKDDHMLASMGPLMGLSRLSGNIISKAQYLDQFGHRSDHELELSIPSPCENPHWLERHLDAYRKNRPDVESLLAAQKKKARIAWKRIEQTSPGKAKGLGKKIGEVAKRAWLREKVRSEYVRVFNVWRQWALQAGRTTGLQQDIFFLRFEEVIGLLRGQKDSLKFIPGRKMAYEQYKQLPPYPTVINGCFDPFKWAADPHRRLDYYDSHAPQRGMPPLTIAGAPGSAGVAEGYVRCLVHPDESDRLQTGEILVTTQTNIGWTLVFPKTAAIITDVGAPLSHAAIVARELGIPAVVGCGNATMRLKTGDRVRVDGTQGKVEILRTDTPKLISKEA
jgi:phosphohistidine swiveling domain-containing protein